MKSRLEAEAGSSLLQKEKKPRWGRKASAALMATTLLTSAGVSAATVANAADDPAAHWHGANYEVAPAGAYGDWNTWLGSMHDPNSTEYAWCIEWGTDAGLTPSSPETITDGNSALFNYIVQTKQGDTSQHSAIAEAAHRLFDPKYAAVWDGTGPAFGTLATASSTAGPRAAADQMIAEAQANAGPYRIQPELVMAPGGKEGTVTGTSVLSASGNAINGWEGKATLNGPAVWAGTNSPAVNLHAGDVLPKFLATGNGRVSVTIDITGAPGASVRKHTVPGQQGMVVTSGTTTVSGQSGDVLMTFDFQPQATSSAVEYVKAGDKLTDVLHVNTSTGGANDWAFVDGKNVPAIFDVDWYYSPVKLDPSPEVPASAKLFTSGSGTANGIGDITVTGAKPASKSGYYYPVASFEKAAQAEELQKYFTGDWKAGFHDPNEQSINKYSPEVVTKASVIEDGKVYDVLTVTGNEPGKELTVTTDLILTSAKPVEGGVDEAPADAEKIGTVTTTVTGNGEFTTEPVEVPWEEIIDEKWSKGLEANLYFSEKIPATNSTNAWDGKELLPNETVPVEKPTVVTKASDNGVVPLVAHDTGIVSGTIPSGEGITVTTKVEQFKFDDSTDGSAQAVCLNPSFTSEDQIVTTAGEIKYPEHTVEHVGTYGYVEELNVTIDKGKGEEPFTAQLHKGKCGEKLETVIAFPQEVTPTLEKPVLAPVVPAGEAVSVEGPNTGLILAGGAMGMLALGCTAAALIRKRQLSVVEAE